MRQYSPLPREETEPTVESDYHKLGKAEVVPDVLATLAPAVVALRTNV